MKTSYRKRFLKDLASLPSPVRAQVEHFVFDEVPQAGSLQETGKAERMTGYPGCYKARFGSYRVGDDGDGGDGEGPGSSQQFH